MYVFLLAGCEVTLSAFVIATGNFLCISRGKEDREAKLEMAEVEGLNHGVEDEENDEGKEEPTEKDNGKVSSFKRQEDIITKEVQEETET